DLTTIATPYLAAISSSLVQNPGLGVQLSGTGNLVGIPPYLGPLAFNGGPTRSHAPLATSLVVDRGENPLGLATDQRGTGFARVLNTVADMGAVESAGTYLPSV